MVTGAVGVAAYEALRKMVVKAPLRAATVSVATGFNVHERTGSKRGFMAGTRAPHGQAITANADDGRDKHRRNPLPVGFAVAAVFWACRFVMERRQEATQSRLPGSIGQAMMAAGMAMLFFAMLFPV